MNTNDRIHCKDCKKDISIRKMRRHRYRCLNPGYESLKNKRFNQVLNRRNWTRRLGRRKMV